MQTPDFWSIPFVSGPPEASAAPALLGAVLAQLAPGVAPPSPLRYDDALGSWLSVHLGREWLPLDAQLRASVALGMIDGPAPAWSWAYELILRVRTSAGAACSSAAAARVWARAPR